MEGAEERPSKRSTPVSWDSQRPLSPFHSAIPLESVSCIWDAAALTRVPWRCAVMGSWECFSFSLTLPYYSELMSYLKVIPTEVWWTARVMKKGDLGLCVFLPSSAIHLLSNGEEIAFTLCWKFLSCVCKVKEGEARTQPLEQIFLTSMQLHGTWLVLLILDN